MKCFSAFHRAKLDSKDTETLWLNKIRAGPPRGGIIDFISWYLARTTSVQASSSDSTQTTKKVTIVGPECTGKTDLSQYLSTYFKTTWVPEYARAYLNKLNRPYEPADLTKIAHGQLRLEDEWIQDANRVLICDTNLLVIKIWSEDKFGNCDPEILKLMQHRKYDLLLLTNIDVPWEHDPQREHPDRREHFWKIYQQETAHSGIATVEISGDRQTRRSKAVQQIEKILATS